MFVCFTCMNISDWLGNGLDTVLKKVSTCQQCHRYCTVYRSILHTETRQSHSSSDDEDSGEIISVYLERETRQDKRKRTFELEEDCPICFEQDKAGHSVCLVCNASCCNLCWSKVDTCPLCRNSKQ